MPAFLTAIKFPA